MYYDKQGNKITLEQMGILRNDLDYKTVGSTWVNNYLISTVWLGIDHNLNLGNGKPIIFETMVFKADCENKKVLDWLELDANRYSSEQEALDGHEQMVKEWSNKTI